MTVQSRRRRAASVARSSRRKYRGGTFVEVEIPDYKEAIKKVCPTMKEEVIDKVAQSIYSNNYKIYRDDNHEFVYHVIRPFPPEISLAQYAHDIERRVIHKKSYAFKRGQQKRREKNEDREAERLDYINPSTALIQVDNTLNPDRDPNAPKTRNATKAARMKSLSKKEARRRRKIDAEYAQMEKEYKLYLQTPEGMQKKAERDKYLNEDFVWQP